MTTQTFTPLPPTLFPAQEGKFGSYEPEDVTWLLTDLSSVPLERGTKDREEAIQTGTHYSEMLPIEYQPDDAYLALFHQALTQTSSRLATAVALVAELVWEEHAKLGTTPVLVSLARAGTPIGVLLRRYYQHAYNTNVPHYTISIIRGKGIDEAALAHILAQHSAAALRFVDGWTGKGAIQKQLNEAVAEWKTFHPEDALLDPRLAVLADPGHCTELYGTRDDFLIPSACLNSTVSGLVSRTVYRPDLIQPGMFHGAKFYSEWQKDDVSRLYVNTVANEFPHVTANVHKELPELRASHRTATWLGWETVRQVAQQYDIHDMNLVKPGVGETTRVLLRRVPWKVLVRPDRRNDLQHVLSLANNRNVPILEVPDLPYSCVGLIRQVTES